MTYIPFVGIDIAADSATISWRTADRAAVPAWTIAQQPDAFAALIADLGTRASPAQTRVVLEATRTYWLPLAHALHTHGFAVSVVNPSQPHHFAKLRLQRTKTDAVDARLLTDFAFACPSPGWTPLEPVLAQLRHCLTLRSDLLAIRTQQRNRLHALHHDPHADPLLLELLHQQLAHLQQQLDPLTAHLLALLHSHHPYADAVRRLLTRPGLGPLSVAWIVRRHPRLYPLYHPRTSRCLRWTCPACPRLRHKRAPPTHRRARRTQTLTRLSLHRGGRCRPL